MFDCDCVSYAFSVERHPPPTPFCLHGLCLTLLDLASWMEPRPGTFLDGCWPRVGAFSRLGPRTASVIFAGSVLLFILTTILALFHRTFRIILIEHSTCCILSLVSNYPFTPFPLLPFPPTPLPSPLSFRELCKLQKPHHTTPHHISHITHRTSCIYDTLRDTTPTVPCVLASAVCG